MSVEHLIASDLAPANAGDVSLAAPIFDHIFPFHLFLDRDLRIVRAGPFITRIAGLQAAAPFNEHFQIKRPLLDATFDAIAARKNAIAILTARSPDGFTLRGEFVQMNADVVAFLGNPWITSTDDLKRYGLTTRDFPAHDSFSDLLILLQTQKAALEDAQKLALELGVARDAALQAMRVKTEFLANMSHELRTPLNAILGFSDILARETFGALPPRYANYAEYIRSSGAMLLSLVNDLLDLSRLESGEYVLSEAPVAVAPTLEECLSFVLEDAQRKNLGLKLQNAATPLTLRVDPRAFKQIILNLLSNAVKFTGEGGTIEMTVSRTPNAAVISVSDSGIGIAHENIGQVFEPFRQGDATTSHKYGGTGLGLSISRQLVELHGGSIQLASEPGVGTSAIVQFPRARIIEQ